MIKSGVFILGLLFLPIVASANVVISEIMYDLEGSDSTAGKGREWVEIWNNSSSEINLSGWKFNDGDSATNHGLDEPPAQGLMAIPGGGYLILAVDASTFISDHHNYNGAVIDILGVNSFNNTAAVLKLIDNNGIEIASASYAKEMGAAGDGNSLQYSGGNLVANSPTPGAANANGGSQSQQTQESQTQQQSQSSSGSSASSDYIPPEQLPRIKADGGADRAAVVGANAEFRGQAFGLDNKPLSNARYLWTFGDGFTKEGQNIFHSYQYPGEYIAVLNVSSGEYSASDTILVKAISNQVFISEIKTAGNGSDAAVGASWIELENRSKEEIDISGMQIKNSGQIFTLPKSSRIRPNSYLAIPTSAGGFIVYSGKGSVELFYPGGFKADVFNYDGFSSSKESFNRGENGVNFISQETPGAKNIQGSSSFVQNPVSNKIPNNNVLIESGNRVNSLTSGVPENPVDSENEKSEEDTGQANIITTSSATPSKSNFKIYLFAVFGLVIFAGGAVLFIRRKSPV